MLSTFASRRLPRTILAVSLGAAGLAACQAAGPTSIPATPRPAPATGAPTPAPTVAAAALGTITLTDTGCTWAGNPGSIDAGPVTIAAWNETDDFADFIVHRLHPGKTWADGVANVAAIQAALPTGAEWPPAVSDVVLGADASAGLGNGLAFIATAGTYGVICSGSTGPTGDILTVFLVGPLVVGT